MNPSKIRKLFNAASVGSGCLAASMLAWTVFPSANPDSDDTLLGRRASVSRELADQEESLALERKRWEELWNRPLQGQTLTASKPTPKPVVRRVPEPDRPQVRTQQATLGLKLIGTVIEPGNSVAIMSDSSGTLAFAGSGESIDLAPAAIKILRIADGVVTINHEGDEHELRLGNTKSIRAGGSGASLRNQATATASESDTQRETVPMTPDGAVDEPNRTSWEDKMSLEDELDMLNGDPDDFDDGPFDDSY